MILRLVNKLLRPKSCMHTWFSTGKPFPEHLRRPGYEYLCGKCKTYVKM